MPALCDFSGAHFLLFSENVPPLVYYSHLPVALIAFLIGLFVWLKNKYLLPNQILFVLTTSFSAWVILDSIFWATNRSDVIMTVWALTVLIEPLVHASTLYLVQVLISKQDIPTPRKILLGILYAPLIVLVPTKYTLTAFNLSTCLSEEHLFSYYSYLIEVIFTAWMLIYATLQYLKTNNTTERRKIFLITLGALILLVAFSWGAITGSFTEDWNIAQFGLFGMPIFIGLLAYSIVQFKLFNLKLIGANVIVLGLWILTASILFVTDLDYIRVILGITLIFLAIFGYFLINGVRREVKQKEELEKLSGELQAANEKLKQLDKAKTEFVSIASHQLRAPLTAIKGYSSMLLEGTFGDLSDKVHGAIDIIYLSSQKLVNVIEDFLNITRIELGTMKYEESVFDLRTLVDLVVKEQQHAVEQRGLKLTYTPGTDSYNIRGDSGKLSQVISNLVDNAAKYTQAGGVAVGLSKVGGQVRVTVKDTGMGLSPEAISQLFQKFVRASDAGKVNVTGTGLGLYVAKQIIDAHHGKIWAESEGPGKGSTFIVELAEANDKK